MAGWYCLSGFRRGVGRYINERKGVGMCRNVRKGMGRCRDVRRGVGRYMDVRKSREKAVWLWRERSASADACGGGGGGGRRAEGCERVVHFASVASRDWFSRPSSHLLFLG